MNTLLLTLAIAFFASVSLADAWGEMGCDDESILALACEFDNYFTCMKCWTIPCSLDVCDTNCQDLSCSVMRECINTNCIGCETEFFEYGNCKVYNDCGVDCRQECARAADDAIEECEASQIKSETCVNCLLKGMPDPENIRCDGFVCDLISQCLIDESCGDCKTEYQNGFDCVTKEYCNFTCFGSTRKLERNEKPGLLLRRVRKVEPRNTGLVETLASGMGRYH
jgi:hypothetical protein